MADGYLLNDNTSPIVRNDPSHSLKLIILPAGDFPLKVDFQAQISHHGPEARAPVSVAGLYRRWVGRLGTVGVVSEIGAWAGFGS